MADEVGVLPVGSWIRATSSVGQRLGILATTVPRTLLEWLQSSRRPAHTLPPPTERSVRQAGEIGVDEFFLAANALLRPVPHRASLQSAVKDTARLVKSLEHVDPLELHPDPRPLTDPEIRPRFSYGILTERVSFPSECTLPGPLAERAPWTETPACATVQAVVLRHPGPPRPWVVCVHGAGQGRGSDLVSFRARHLHRDLGLNVALPVLPLHGRRLVRGHKMPGFDLPSNVAAVVHGVFDIRRLITWIAQQDAPHIAVYGVSLGAHTASILAGVEPAVDTVIAGIPVTGLSRLLTYHLERFGGPRGRQMTPLMASETVAAVDRFINPTALPVQPPRARRFIFAGLGDYVTTPEQALDLWEHWERPQLSWYPGGHVGHVWSKEVKTFVDSVLSRLDGAGGAPPKDGVAPAA